LPSFRAFQIQVVYICAELYQISTGTPASRGPSAIAGLLVLDCFETVSLPNRNVFDKQSKQLEELFRPHTPNHTRIKTASSMMVEPWVGHYFYTPMCLYESHLKANTAVFQHLTHLVATLTY